MMPPLCRRSESAPVELGEGGAAWPIRKLTSMGGLFPVVPGLRWGMNIA